MLLEVVGVRHIHEAHKNTLFVRHYKDNCPRMDALLLWCSNFWSHVFFLSTLLSPICHFWFYIPKKVFTLCGYYYTCLLKSYFISMPLIYLLYSLCYFNEEFIDPSWEKGHFNLLLYIHIVITHIIPILWVSRNI